MTWTRESWDAAAPAAVFAAGLAIAPELGTHEPLAVTTAVLAVVTAAGAVLVRSRTALLVALLGWLLLTGFGVHRFAALTPFEPADVARLALLVTVALVVSRTSVALAGRGGAGHGRLRRLGRGAAAPEQLAVVGPVQRG